MAQRNEHYTHIPKEKFAFVNHGERISDKKFDDKPIGAFKDAWIRFRKNKASVVAAIIIIVIVLFSFIMPMAVTDHDQSFMVTEYQKLPARLTWLRDLGIADGGENVKDLPEADYIKLQALALGAENPDGGVDVLSSAADSDYQPILKTNGYRVVEAKLRTQADKVYYDVRVDSYLEVGFKYLSIEQSEYQAIKAWEEETGIIVLYPLIADNEYSWEGKTEAVDPNVWYKVSNSNKTKCMPLGEDLKVQTYSDDMLLVDNYLRDEETGELVYWTYTGGGNYDTAQYRVRVLFYNYYQYRFGNEPNYFFGTDSVGYDLALRIAGGIQTSLLIAICVSVINFVLGALYGSVEGYYGGWIDLVMERISDILSGVPFMVVATLFQIHLAKKVGPIPSLLFAYVATGWIGTASRVRSQFYRFKNQEYVMAARTLGARDRRIIWKHIFPNTLGTLITSSALVIPGVILNESMLSYLGIIKLGGTEGTSLGTLLSDASGIWFNYPHLMLYPALVISLLMICFNLFGNGLRDAFNPALRGVEE